MPMYRWRDSETGLELEVIRRFDDYQVVPTEDEVATETKQAIPEPTPVRAWVRVMDGKITVLRGAGWRGAKGHW